MKYLPSILGGLQGFLLASVGVGIDRWQFWAIMLITCAVGLVAIIGSRK